MAFYNKVGLLLKQSLCARNGMRGESPIFNSIRCMSTKLFVGGLSYTTDDKSLKDAFSSFGDVVDARIITDRDSGRSRGFGFVNFSSDESASSAVSGMDGQELNGRTIRVSYATERAPRRDFNTAGGSGGGYGYSTGQSNDY